MTAVQHRHGLFPDRKNAENRTAALIIAILNIEK
jgi:hypothetical protein